MSMFYTLSPRSLPPSGDRWVTLVRIISDESNESYRKMIWRTVISFTVKLISHDFPFFNEAVGLPFLFLLFVCLFVCFEVQNA